MIPKMVDAVIATQTEGEEGCREAVPDVVLAESVASKAGGLTDELWSENEAEPVGAVLLGGVAR